MWLRKKVLLAAVFAPVHEDQRTEVGSANTFIGLSVPKPSQIESKMLILIYKEASQISLKKLVRHSDNQTFLSFLFS